MYMAISPCAWQLSIGTQEMKLDTFVHLCYCWFCEMQGKERLAIISNKNSLDWMDFVYVSKIYEQRRLIHFDGSVPRPLCPQKARKITNLT